MPKGLTLVEGVLLTEKVENPVHAMDLMYIHSEDKLRCVGDVAKLLSRLHNEHSPPWCDAWLGNAMCVDDAPILFGFGFKPYHKRSLDELFADHIISLYIYAKYGADLPATQIVDAVLDSYYLEKNTKDELKQRLRNDIIKNNTPLVK